jgi:hypothetical protein
MTVSPDTITFGTLSTPSPSNTITPIEGATVSIPTTDPGAPGRTYRLGRQISTNVFEIEPGDMLAKAAGPDGLWGTPDDVVDNVSTGAIYSAQTTLQPQVAYATVYNASDSVAGRITLASNLSAATASGTGVSLPVPFSGGTPSSNVAPANAVSGAFVIVIDDYPYDASTPTTAAYNLPLNNSTTTPPLLVGSLNGRIFRLGDAIPANPSGSPPIPVGTFDLDPAYGMQSPGTASPDQIPNPNLPASAKGPWARVFIIGAGRTNPTSSASADVTGPTAFSGNAQDVSVYTTYIPVQ